jgi:hypothetical protein
MASVRVAPQAGSPNRLHGAADSEPWLVGAIFGLQRIDLALIELLILQGLVIYTWLASKELIVALWLCLKRRSLDHSA